MKIIFVLLLIVNILNADILTNQEKKEIIKSVNLNYPMKLGAGANLVQFNIIGNTFMYMANLDNTSDLSEERKQNMRHMTATGICTDKYTLPYLNKGMHYAYTYRNTETYQVLYQFDLSIKDCSGLSN